MDQHDVGRLEERFLNLPPHPPTDPLDEFNKVLAESREIRERVTQGLQDSLVEPAFSDTGGLSGGPAPSPVAEPTSSDVPVSESVPEPSPV